MNHLKKENSLMNQISLEGEIHVSIVKPKEFANVGNWGIQQSTAFTDNDLKDFGPKIHLGKVADLREGANEPPAQCRVDCA